tara:strand:- start:124 stop:288 length:165 start_codon:yes stop_codon:yes gene_type:complete
MSPVDVRSIAADAIKAFGNPALVDEYNPTNILQADAAAELTPMVIAARVPVLGE